MYDKYNRKINYLRISITDRCNLRCRYCMPEEGVPLLRHGDILSLEEIAEIARVATTFGINKVRITGGEPLVRKGVINLVHLLRKIPEILDLSLTTNGILLREFAQPLAKAGLNRVNISLDTLDPFEYNRITRGGELEKVMQGIDAAVEAGLLPVKINCVVKESPFEENALQVSAFCREKGLQVRFITRMDLKKGKFSIVHGGTGGDCENCNRLRLTANGYIKPCLFNDMGFNVRILGAKNAISEAVNGKPQCGTQNTNGNFYNIGG
jgi:cyclic pyranopterin phosphate synthase